MSHRHRLSWAEVRAAVLDCGVLSLACLFAYWLVTFVFSRVYSLSRADDLVGSLWAKEFVGPTRYGRNRTRCPFWQPATHKAVARYVFPVPAGGRTGPWP